MTADSQVISGDFFHTSPNIGNTCEEYKIIIKLSNTTLNSYFLPQWTTWNMELGRQVFLTVQNHSRHFYLYKSTAIPLYAKIHKFTIFLLIPDMEQIQYISFSTILTMKFMAKQNVTNLIFASIKHQVFNIKTEDFKIEVKLGKLELARDLC